MSSHVSHAELLFDEAMIANGVVERHPIQEKGGSSVNPSAEVAFRRVVQNSDLDDEGTDRVVYVRTARWNGRAVSYKLGHAVRHQWIPIEMQIKGIPEGAPDFGRNTGILLPLRDKLTVKENERITPDMLWIVAEHRRKHPEVTLMLFISCVPFHDKEACARAYKAIWHEVRHLVIQYLAIICGAAPRRRNSAP